MFLHTTQNKFRVAKSPIKFNKKLLKSFGYFTQKNCIPRNLGNLAINNYEKKKKIQVFWKMIKYTLIARILGENILNIQHQSAKLARLLP
jgi:hypothetical protein